MNYGVFEVGRDGNARPVARKGGEGILGLENLVIVKILVVVIGFGFGDGLVFFKVFPPFEAVGVYREGMVETETAELPRRILDRAAYKEDAVFIFDNGSEGEARLVVFGGNRVFVSALLYRNGLGFVVFSGGSKAFLPSGVALTTLPVKT